MFEILIEANIYIKSIRVFIDYLSVELLSEYINSIELTTLKEKIRIISILFFLNSL